MNAGSARQLGQAADRILNVSRRNHHKVGQLVDDDDDLRQKFIRMIRLAHGFRLDEALVVGDEVAGTGLGEDVVAALHFLDHPFQRGRRLLDIGDDRRQKMRDVRIIG